MVEGVSAIVSGPAVFENGVPDEGAVVGIGKAPTGLTDAEGTIEGGGVVEDIGAVVAGLDDLENGGDV